MRLILTLPTSLVLLLDDPAIRPDGQSRSEYIREAIRQRLARETAKQIGGTES